MYHDQGLPVLKAASFGRGVNVTLGLPFIRTSVDHGTALDLALDAERAKTADAGSLVRGGGACDRARDFVALAFSPVVILSGAKDLLFLHCNDNRRTLHNGRR